MRSLGGLGVKWEGAEAGKMTPNEHKYRFFWWKNGCLQGNFGSLKVIEKEERDNKAERYFNTKLDLRLGKAHLKIWCRMLKNPHTNIRHWHNLFKYPNKTSFDSNWCNRRHDNNNFFKFFQISKDKKELSIWSRNEEILAILQKERKINETFRRSYICLPMNFTTISWRSTMNDHSKKPHAGKYNPGGIVKMDDEKLRKKRNRQRWTNRKMMCWNREQIQ